MRVFSKVLLTVWQGCSSPIFVTWSAVLNFPFPSQCYSLPSECEMHFWCCWWETLSRCKCWETGEVMKLPPSFEKERDLIYYALIWKAKLTSLAAPQARMGQHKVCDPLWGSCLFQSLLWVLGESQPVLAGCLQGGVCFHERENTLHLWLMSKSPSTTWKTMVPGA